MRRSAANAFFLAVFALLGSTHAAAASNAAICPVSRLDWVLILVKARPDLSI